MANLVLQHIDVSYDDKNLILKDLSIDVEDGKLVSFLGPSGCGKTTALRVIAGFITPQNGQVILGDKDYSKIPVHKRNFGIVFQTYALFPHLTVFENIAFGLKQQHMSKQVIERKVQDILSLVDLDSLAQRFPKELSGGQRQRVAIARALVVEPKILLLDEPLSNLDAKLRLKMRVEIRQLQQKLGITTIFVTHDQEECFSISDKVAVMNNGIIEQYDTPEVIYSAPKTEFVARFVGFENFFTLRRTEDERLVLADGTMVSLMENMYSTATGERLVATIRPDDIIISDYDETLSDEENQLVGTVTIRTYLGKQYQYKVETPVGLVTVNTNKAGLYRAGDSVLLHLQKDKLLIVK